MAALYNVYELSWVRKLRVFKALVFWQKAQERSVCDIRHKAHPHVVIEWKHQYVCLEMAVPPFPDLAFVHPPIATPRGFTFCSLSRVFHVSCSLFTFFFSPFFSLLLRLFYSPSLPPWEARRDKYPHTFLSCLYCPLIPCINAVCSSFLRFSEHFSPLALSPRDTWKPNLLRHEFYRCSYLRLATVSK